METVLGVLVWVAVICALLCLFRPRGDRSHTVVDPVPHDLPGTFTAATRPRGAVGEPPPDPEDVQRRDDAAFVDGVLVGAYFLGHHFHGSDDDVDTRDADLIAPILYDGDDLSADAVWSDGPSEDASDEDLMYGEGWGDEAWDDLW